MAVYQDFHAALDYKPPPPVSSLCPMDRSWWADVYVTVIVLVSLVIFIRLSVTIMRERRRDTLPDPGTCRVLLWMVMFTTGLIVLITLYIFNIDQLEEAVVE